MLSVGLVRRKLRFVPMVAAAALLLSGCGLLGLEDTSLQGAGITTSAAPVANPDADGSVAAEVTIPTLGTASPEPAPTPTPWQSLTTTAAPTTSSEPPQTAPTRTSKLTFTTLAEVTKPTVAAPTSIVQPPPDCYVSGACPVQASASVAGGSVEIVSPPGKSQTVAIYLAGGKPAGVVSLARVTSPKVECSDSFCLIQGSQSGLFFGSVLRIKGAAISSVPGVATSETRLHLVGGSTAVVAGTFRFDGYGMFLDDSPVASRTWAVKSGSLEVTGCGQPYLYRQPPIPTEAARGACRGTPQIHGYGPSSANELVSLSGFVTPSGNIQCGLLPNDRLVCGAKKSTISVPKCTDATLTGGTGLTGLRVTMGTGGVVRKDDCIGYDLVGLPQTKIGYGRLAVARGFVCEVAEDGVTCTAPSGHGFSLSRSAVSPF